MIRSSDVVFNEDSINSVQTKPRIGKRVSLEYSLTKFEDEMPNAKPKVVSDLTNQAKLAINAISRTESTSMPID